MALVLTLHSATIWLCQSCVAETSIGLLNRLTPKRRHQVLSFIATIVSCFSFYYPRLCEVRSNLTLPKFAEWPMCTARRNYKMSRIKGKDTKPEMLVRRFLHGQGYRYRLHVKTLPGKPDIVLPRYKTVILIHGCFWHGHEGCRYYVVPKTRTEWWLNKINRNKENDSNAVKALKKDG